MSRAHSYRTDDERMQEYLRRNLNVCKSIGAVSGARAILNRLENMKRVPKWLIAGVHGIYERTTPLTKDLVNHRDELSPYKPRPATDHSNQITGR